MILSTIFILISGSSYSQIKFGIRGGVNWNYVKADDILLDNNTVRLTIPSKANLGYHFGLISQIKLFNIFVQPELLFTFNKNDVILKNELTQQNTGFAEQKISRLDLPILAGVKFNAFKVEAGPVGTLIMGSKSNLVDISDYDLKFKSMTFGYQVGIGLDFAKISLDFKYEGNLSKLGDKLTLGNQTFNFDQRANQLIFGIGLFF